jgi:hypothetical protein
MSYNATVLKVMIASPSDVAAERNIVRDALSEWNIVNSDSRCIVLLPIGWETHSIPEMGDRPQALINKQVLNGCDLLVGVFWTRIGTATGEYESGTIEEIEEHIKAGKPVMLYFSNAPVVLDSVDSGQWAKLQSFKESCRSRGLFESYSDLDEFRSKFFRQLQLKINQDWNSISNDSQPTVLTTTQSPTSLALSREAKVLLKACSNDQHGQILHLNQLSGPRIQVGGKNMIEDNSPRSRALWEGAFSELETGHLIEATGTKRQIFKMTREGYAVADQIAL